MRDKRLLLLLSALAVFLIALGRRDIVISHEARVAQTARQMSAAGAPWNANKLTVPTVAMKDIGNGVMRLVPAPEEGSFQINLWLVPVLNTQIRLQKPPLPYWCDAICFDLFGTSSFSARLVPALLGAFCTILVYDLARQLSTRRVAMYAALAWVSTHFALEEFRKSMADPYLAFATLLAITSWIRATAPGLAAPRARRGATAGILIFYIAIAFGMLAKGPLILIWLVITLVSFHVATKRALPRGAVAHLLGFALFLLLGCSWYLFIYFTVPHAMDLWKYESLGELSSNTENYREWWFYFANAPLILLPWAAVILIGIVRQLRKRRWFFILWPALSLLLFTFVNQKKNAYLLPATPPLAILTGMGLQTLLSIDRAKRGIKWPGILAGVHASVGIGFAAVLVFLSRHSGWLAIVILSGSAIIAAYPLLTLLRGNIRRWPIDQTIAFAIVLTVFITVYESSRENQRSARPFGQSVERIVDSAGGRIVPAATPEEVSFYLPLNYTGPRRNRQVFSIIDDPRNTITVDDSRLIYASESGRWKLLRNAPNHNGFVTREEFVNPGRAATTQP